MQFKFRKKYLILALAFFIIEVIIGMYVNDRIIRPYGGDFLVVMLIYFILRSFWNQRPIIIAVAVLIFSYSVEFAQHFKLVEILGLKGNRFAEIMIGTDFSWWDMLAYTLGIIVVYYVDIMFIDKNLNKGK